MICKSKKFILILPPKTGGTSILQRLLHTTAVYKKIDQQHGGFDYFETEQDYKNEIKAKHKALKDYKQHTDYKTYGVVRNPYDRMVSWWIFDRNQGNRQTFKKYLNENTWRDLTYHYYFSDDTHIVSNIIRFENLQRDFDSMCDDIKIPRQTLPHRNKTNHKHYTEYYDDEAREIVAKKYARDIELFGYKFGQ